MSTPVTNRRSIRNILINRPLQREFTLYMIGIMMMAGVIVSMMIHWTLSGLTEGSPRTISRLALERMVLDVNAQLMLGTILIIFTAVILTGLFGIFFLHRVAGPVYRFKMVLKQIASGETPRQVKLREHDFFKETATELNHVIQALRQYEDASKQIDALLVEYQNRGEAAEITARIRGIQKTLTRDKSVSS